MVSVNEKYDYLMIKSTCRSSQETALGSTRRRWLHATEMGRLAGLRVIHWALINTRPVRVLLSSPAGSMGLDVPKTNLVVLNSSPSTAWEFSQEVSWNWNPVPEVIILHSLDVLVEVGHLQYVSTSGRRARRPHLNCASMSGRITPSAWKRGLSAFSPSPILTVYSRT